MKGWYQAAVDWAPSPTQVTLKRITTENMDLYSYVPPPGENIPISVETFLLDGYDTTTKSPLCEALSNKGLSLKGVFRRGKEEEKVGSSSRTRNFGGKDDGSTPEENDNYVNASVMFPKGNSYARWKVIGQKLHAYGNAVGRSYDNPIPDTREYSVEFDDGEVRKSTEM